eukprot:gene29842-17943_t
MQGGHRRTKSVQSDLPWATEENNLAPVVKQSYNADAPHYRPKARPPELPVPMYSPGPHLQYSPPPQQYNQPRAFQRSSSHKEMYQPPTPIGGAASKDPPTPSGRNPSGKHPSDSCQQYNILTGAVMYQAPAQRKSQAQAQHDMYKPPDVPYLAHAHSAPQQPEYYAPEPKYNNYCPPSHAPPYPPRHPSEANQQYARHSSEIYRHIQDIIPKLRPIRTISRTRTMKYRTPLPPNGSLCEEGPHQGSMGTPIIHIRNTTMATTTTPRGSPFQKLKRQSSVKEAATALQGVRKRKSQSSVKEAARLLGVKLSEEAPPSRGSVFPAQPTGASRPSAPREPSYVASVGPKSPVSRHSSASGETPHHSAHISRMPPRGGASSNHAPLPAQARVVALAVSRGPATDQAGQANVNPPRHQLALGPATGQAGQANQAASAGLTSAPLRRAANPVLRTHPQAQEPVSAGGGGG